MFVVNLPVSVAVVDLLIFFSPWILESRPDYFLHSKDFVLSKITPILRSHLREFGFFRAETAHQQLNCVYFYDFKRV